MNYTVKNALVHVGVEQGKGDNMKGILEDGDGKDGKDEHSSSPWAVQGKIGGKDTRDQKGGA